MATQQNSSDQAPQSLTPNLSKQQGGGGKEGRPAHPAEQPSPPVPVPPDTVREIQIGSPMSPAEMEELKREAQKPKPRPTRKNGDPEEGQQDPHHDE